MTSQTRRPRRSWMTRAVPLAWAGTALVAMSGPLTAQQANEQGQAPAPVLLAPIVVEGAPGVVTEDTGSYTTERATVGYKQPVDIDDVPQTVTVITRQRLDDAGATTLEEAGYLTPNLSTATGNMFDGSLYSRGHEVFTYNVDGAPRPFLSLYGTAPDLVFFDRVEVLSGPSGVFQGSGEPVGTINLVRKRPTGANGASAAGTIGSYGLYRGEGDVTVSPFESGRVRGRVIGYGQTRESFVDFVEQDRGGGYATIEVDVTEGTTLSAGAIAESQDTVSTSGFPTFTDGTLIDVSRDFYLGAPWNQREINTAEGFAEAEHVFESGGVLKVAGRTYSRNTDIKNALASTGVDPTTGDFDMLVFARRYDEVTSYVDANYSAPFTFRGRDSAFTIGSDYRHSDSGFKQNFDFSLGTQNINTFDPNTLVEPTITYPGVGPGFRLNTETEATEIGGYGYVRLQVLDGLNLTLGARYADYQSETEDTGRGTQTSDIDEQRFVPLVGLSYAFTPQVTGYTSFSEIFQPQSEQAADGSQLDPIVGRQAEVGTKVSLYGGRLRAQAAVFWLEDENRAEDDPNNVGAFVASGRAETKGFEAMITGRPIPSVDLVAGYTYVDTDLDDDPTPPHSIVAFGKYTFLDGPLESLYLGAGVRAVSEFDNTVGGIKVEADGYTVVDLAAGYEIGDNVAAQLTVKNLFDNKYIDRVNDTTRGTFYGEPLTAMVRVKVTY